ncbi:MAG: AmmeMemoRadiSam system radical SAM enzyme, partial [Candidatus Aegiribacteria sp.]|nr:AmmeMemoRadiSam system radical SAM enzyme [Candidatus Aegiribacteria sp.]MBD3294030.1 AmmeMemoRadiSam system radical SAM enzyme [Candidatus Fermentibacteria bacterium]
CVLCPHMCQLEPGERGRCSVRLNNEGQLVSLVYGKPAAVQIDPVEKKPLFHFLPGIDVLSIATAGCNLRCDFCQNWEISQAAPEEVNPFDMSPEAVVEAALEYNCRGIAYTYTEPVVFFEYTRDCAALAREAGLKNILVTAGYINPGPLSELAGFIDAANVDLKSMSDSYYREVCGGTLQPVLNTIVSLKDSGVWVEVTNLVVPSMNDDQDGIEELCRWILSNTGEETPLHFSRFFPMYRLTDLPPTPLETLDDARSTALEVGLKHVYVGNAVIENGMVTSCPACGEDLIVRQGYLVTENSMVNGKCGYCRHPVAGVWNETEEE